MNEITLREARETYFATASLRKQTICPCCDRPGAYRFDYLNHRLTTGLIWLCRVGRGGFVHLPSHADRKVLTGNCIGKGVWWGLTEAMPNEDDPAKVKSGYWRATERCWEWMRGERRLPHRALVYNDSLIQMDRTKLIGPAEALKKPFDIRECYEGWKGE